MSKESNYVGYTEGIKRISMDRDHGRGGPTRTPAINQKAEEDAMVRARKPFDRSGQVDYAGFGGRKESAGMT